MRLRHLFEAPAKKIVAVMPGGFHPFHPGHKSLYDWAVETFGKENVYVAATNDTTTRPFPFDVKIKLAQMAGVPTNRFIQVKSPFNALSYDNIIGDASQTALIFVRSEKDKSSHPLPDQIRKSDGNMGYLISYKGNDDLETADTHGYLAYGPTIDFDFSGMAINSASQLREAWPTMSPEDKMKAAELMYPGNGQTAVQLLDKALGVEPVAAEDVAEGMFGIDSKTKGSIMNVVAKLSDIPGMWDHKDQTFTPDGLEKLAEVLKHNHEHLKYALNLTADDFEADESIEETIRKVEGGYRLYSKDGKKNLGTFDTRAGAEKHEREVQYFKHKG